MDKETNTSTKTAWSNKPLIGKIAVTVVNLINKQTTTAQSVFWNRCFTAWNILLWRHTSRAALCQIGERKIYFRFKYDLGTKVWPHRSSNSRPPDHDSTWQYSSMTVQFMTVQFNDSTVQWQYSSITVHFMTEQFNDSTVHNSTVQVTATPALTTQLSVTSWRNALPCYLRGPRWFQMHVPSDRLMHWRLIF